MFNGVSWLIYWIGHAVSRLCVHPANDAPWFGWTIHITYPIYNTLMGWSVAIQEMGGDRRGPWAYMPTLTKQDQDDA